MGNSGTRMARRSVDIQTDTKHRIQDDPSCQGVSIPECITRTLAKLETMEEELKQQSADFERAKANLTSAQQKLAADTNSKIKGMDAKIGDTKNDIEKDIELAKNETNSEIAENKNSISSNSAKITNLITKIANLTSGGYAFGGGF